MYFFPQAFTAEFLLGALVMLLQLMATLCPWHLTKPKHLSEMETLI